MEKNMEQINNIKTEANQGNNIKTERKIFLNNMVEQADSKYKNKVSFS